MKYAIIGLGFIYPRHKQSIERTGGEVVLTCDNDPLKNADFLDWKTMFRSERFKEVDCVVVCTPNHLHGPISFAALLAGKKVICEKPAVINAKDLDLLDGITPILQLRYHPKIEELKKKNVKHIDMAITMYRDKSYFAGWKGDWRKSGGLLFNLGIHYLDILIHLLGPVKRIIGAKSDIVGYDDVWDEWFEGDIEHENGFSHFIIELCQDERPRAKSPSRNITVTFGDGAKEDVELSQKENLSYEDLHTKEYEAFLNGTALTASDARPAIALANDLYKANKGQ